MLCNAATRGGFQGGGAPGHHVEKNVGGKSPKADKAIERRASICKKAAQQRERERDREREGTKIEREEGKTIGE